MAAFPFGGHPRFREYLEWAKEQGCTVESKIHEGELTLTKIIRKDGKRAVIEVDISPDAYLLPSQIGYYDRALGLGSPWFSV